MNRQQAVEDGIDARPHIGRPGNEPGKFRWPSVLLLTLLIPTISGFSSADAGAASPPQPQQCKKIVLSGEVSLAEAWSAPIGGGWLFRLVPIAPSANASANARYSGWDLSVSRMDDGNYPDALLLATPPYGSLNEHEIGTTYGLRAQDAIAWTPRRFQFLTTPSELARARDLYRTLISSPAQNPRTTSDAASELLRLIGTSPSIGRGVFTVLDSRFVEGAGDAPPFAAQWAARLGQVPHTVEPAGNTPSPRGELRWIRFRVELQLPAGWKLPPGMRSKAANCAQ